MPNQLEIDKAVNILHQGGLVAFPTETVYGLGADATNPHAIKKIFAAKQRPTDHPVIVHLADVNELSQWAEEITDSARALAKAFWPGPLTLIFKKQKSVSDLLTGGQETIGIRIPQHPMARALLKTFGKGIAAPSANRYGRISPTTAQAVEEEIGSKVDLILNGGQCEVGVESTIVDVSGNDPVILRPGIISTQEIETVLQKKISTTQKNSPRTSGTHESHYAPATPAELMSKDAIQKMLAQITEVKLPIVILAHQDLQTAQTGVEIISMSPNVREYAHDLYAKLRDCDKKNFQRIIIQTIPEQNEWDAIRDRLQRATQKA